MYKLTLPAAIIDRNFERSDTNIRIDREWYQYQTNGTCIDITGPQALITYLCEQGFELKVSAITPNHQEHASLAEANRILGHQNQFISNIKRLLHEFDTQVYNTE